LLNADARLQPCEDANPLASTILEIRKLTHHGVHLALHHDGNKDLGRIADLNTSKIRSANANDGHRVAIQMYGRTHNVSISPEPRGPKVVGQDRNRFCAHAHVFFGSERAAKRGTPPEHVKVVPRPKFARDPLRAPAIAEADRRGVIRKSTREHSIPVANIAIHRVGKAVLTPTGTEQWSSRCQLDQLLRIIDWQQP